jgi:hypothetical protein
MSESEKVVFFQPVIGISAKVKPHKGRAKALTRTSHCRALLNGQIGGDLKKCFSTIVKERKHVMQYAYLGNGMYGNRNVLLTVATPVLDKKLAENGLDYPAELSIASTALKRRVGANFTYGEDGRAEKKPIPQSRLRDFFYLADLLCGTFSVLFTPSDKEPMWRKSPVPKAVPVRLSYLGGSSLALLHPALTALFFGQLRLAAFLTTTPAAQELRQEVPTRDLSSALVDGDREKLVKLLRKARPYILRKEHGLWAFNSRNGARFDRLLSYFALGGDAFKLFETNIIKNWGLNHRTPYGVNYHERGFNDYMSSRGRGDKKVMAALEEMKAA